MDISPACTVLRQNGLIDRSNTMDKITSPLQPANKTMRFMKDRLDTFMNWSASHIVTPQELAKAGFYNTHRDDRVQCAFCLGVLHNWKKGDTAMGEHRRHFPGCVLVKAIDHIEDAKCKVCMKARVKVVFFPCLHLVCCEHCSYLMTSCAVCQADIQSRLKVFLVSTCPNRIEQAG